MRRAFCGAALFLALGTTTRLGAQASAAVSSEFVEARGQSIVTMDKMPLDAESRLGAFYGFAGRIQNAPAKELTLHLVRSGTQWAWAYDYTVVLILDDKSRMPLPRALRSTSVGEDYMLEQIMMPLSREQAAQIAQAHKVEMKVGSNDFVWSDTLQRAFRQIVEAADGSAPQPAAGTR